jgi:ZIP family zinc transporter
LAAILWGGLAAASLLIGYLFARRGLSNRTAGAMLTMLADAMMPEAFEHGGKLVGIFTVMGFLMAAVLAVME